jgi:hypothetical protein
VSAAVWGKRMPREKGNPTSLGVISEAKEAEEEAKRFL